MLLNKASEMPTREAALPGRDQPVRTDEVHFVTGRPLKGPHPEGFETAIFGMGCFWGVERVFWKLPGVWVTSAGFFAEDYHQGYLAKNPGGYCGIGGTGVTCPIGVGVEA
jgi:hypothetical protein